MMFLAGTNMTPAPPVEERTMRRNFTLVAGVVLASIAAWAAACGGSDENSGVSTGTAAATGASTTAGAGGAGTGTAANGTGGGTSSTTANGGTGGATTGTA